MRTRSIGGAKTADEARAGTNIGIAVTTLHDKSGRGSESGEEMAELARLFADKGKDWGTETSRSRRASVATEGSRAVRRTSSYTDARRE